MNHPVRAFRSRCHLFLLCHVAANHRHPRNLTPHPTPPGYCDHPGPPPPNPSDDSGPDPSTRPSDQHLPTLKPNVPHISSPHNLPLHCHPSPTLATTPHDPLYKLKQAAAPTIAFASLGWY